MKFDMALVLGCVGASFVVVPGILTYLFGIRGVVSIGSVGVQGLGLVAMLPGLLMGAAGLWVAARG